MGFAPRLQISLDRRNAPPSIALSIGSLSLHKSRSTIASSKKSRTTKKEQQIVKFFEVELLSIYGHRESIKKKSKDTIASSKMKSFAVFSTLAVFIAVVNAIPLKVDAAVRHRSFARRTLKAI
jgi:F0F1-type ATP synthase membrane subunit a